jgi:hypothetical protein
VSTAAPNTSQCSSRKATAMISSFDQNPAKGGTPMSAAVPMTNVQNVTGITRRRPPISDMLLE